jgi:hypothetical protein
MSSAMDHVGIAALGCPAEQRSTSFSVGKACRAAAPGQLHIRSAPDASQAQHDAASGDVVSAEIVAPALSATGRHPERL